MTGSTRYASDGTSPATPDIGVVVARYREDTAWLAELGLPGVLYDKGPEPPAALAPGIRREALPNVGREAHTYLTHIIAHYDALPRWTAFVQGDPFAHLTPPEEPRLPPAALRARLLDLVAQDRPFCGLAWFRLRCDALGRPHDLADPAKQGRWEGWGKDIPVGRVFEALFGLPSPAQFIARAPTGNMLVRRDRILARPPEFYQRALSLVLADPHDAENTGHALERLWQAVFSGPGRTG
ncbi:Protein of unknown function [Humidesulfovibrio mexicanus]|uniref:DUF3431 domain-containing protein n=1 Tax=Humidesulfovibrio mexicanus TaxID=147047 RepID=A0A239ACQ6_9BACT|nr:DUF3431 domain-containing protein [Humidesulfovibrio mexicanus]SNR92828.1 Protein of unknown function [Humidesulfovibrio mexicanus]